MLRILAIIGVVIVLIIYAAFVLFMILFEIGCIARDFGMYRKWYDKEAKERGSNI